MYVNNHTDVWGSWYDPSSGTWGYACCHSIIHISYCSGQAGIEAAEASTAQHLLASSAPAPTTPASAISKPPADVQSTAGERAGQNYSKKRVGEGDVKLDKDRLAHAINEEKKRKMRGEDDDERQGKKRKDALDSSTHEVTEEQLGAFPIS